MLRGTLEMDDKVFDLMTKFYNEFSGFKSEVNVKLENLQEGQQKLENDIIRLENKSDNNSKALFDGYQQTFEKLTEIDNKVDNLSNKLDKQEVEIKVIKGGKY